MSRHRKEIICYPAKKSSNGWHIKNNEEKGKGHISTIFQACKKNDCEYVMKLIKKRYNDNIEREVIMQNKCSKQGLCLPVIDWWVCPNSEEYGGVIISPILERNLEDYIRVTKEQKMEQFSKILIWGMMKKALKLLLELHNLGIVHQNVKLSHFILDKNEGMFLIDMRDGKNFKKDEEKLIYNDYATLTRSEDDIHLNLDILLGLGDKIEDMVEEHKITIREAENKVITKIINMSYRDTEDYSRKTRNTYPEFVGIQQMKESLRHISGENNGNLEKFKDWASDSDWDQFSDSNHHYDWWMFPINKSSNKNGWKYTVFESDIQELLQDQSYIADYVLGAKLLIKSWGWNIKTCDFYRNPGYNQEWRRNDVRLKKLSLSLKLFRQKSLFEDLKKYVIYLIKNDMIFDPQQRKEIIEIFNLKNSISFDIISF